MQDNFCSSHAVEFIKTFRAEMNNDVRRCTKHMAAKKKAAARKPAKRKAAKRKPAAKRKTTKKATKRSRR